MNNIAIDMFTNNKVMNILMLLQVSIFIVVSNVLIGINNYNVYCYNKSNYFNDISFVGLRDDNPPDYDKLSELGVGIENVQIKDVSENSLLITYQEKTMEKFRPFLKYGKWFDECEDVRSDAIKCIAVCMTRAIVGRYMTETIGDKTYVFYVCGSFGKEMFYLNYLSGNQDSVIKFNAGGLSKTAYFCEYSSKTDFNYNNNKSSTIAFIPEENYNQTIDYLTPHLNIYATMEDVRNDISNHRQTINSVMIPVALIFGIMGTLNFIGVAIISVKKILLPCFDIHKLERNKTNISQVFHNYFIYLILWIIIACCAILAIDMLLSIIPYKTLSINFNNIIFIGLYTMLLYGIAKLIFMTDVNSEIILPDSQT